MITELTLIESHAICKGEQRVYEHYANTLDCPMRFAIFLPENALDNESCPTLYYLSGLTCTEQNVIQKSGFQRFAQRYDIITVCPDTSPRGEHIPDDERYWIGQSAGHYVNATAEPYAKNYRMYDYINQELPALIDQCFPTNGKQSITGHSMGGFGALYIGLTNPTKFESISAFAPIASPRQSEWGQDVIAAYFAGDESVYQAADPCELIKAAEINVPILVDQGSADDFLEPHLKTHLLQEAAESSGYPIEINLREGYDHSYYFIQSFIRQHFVFHAEYLDAN